MHLLLPLSSETIVFLCARRYLLQNLDWLEEELGEFEDDYLIIDCPGMSDVRMSARWFFLGLSSRLRRAML